MTLSLPSSIWIPPSIALCIALSLQNFSVVSTNHFWSICSLFNVPKISVIVLYSVSLTSFLLFNSMDNASFVGRLLYLVMKWYISLNKILSNLSVKYSSFKKGNTFLAYSSLWIRFLSVVRSILSIFFQFLIQ